MQQNNFSQEKISLQNLTSEKLKTLFKPAQDVKVHAYYHEGEVLPEDNPLLLYCIGMINAPQLNDFLFFRLRHLLPLPAFSAQKASKMPTSRLKGKKDVSFPSPFQQNIKRLEEENIREELMNAVFGGHFVLFFEQKKEIYVIQMASPPQRQPEDSNTEISIKGSRDGFTESSETNVALVRKRLKTTSFCTEYFHLGKRSKTAVVLLYMKDIINKKVLREVQKRIKNISIDGVLSSQFLETSLSDRSFSLFPLIEYVGRPDYVAQELLKGKFAIVVDGNPMVLMSPTNLMSLICSPEDMHFPFYYVLFQRLIRIAGLFTSIFLPGFWVCISAFNLNEIPFPLLATVVQARTGLPISGPSDLILMIILFELFREAGLRLPKAVGQTVAVVGGLIIGDAAINAGFTSPTTLVITAVSAVSTFALVNQSLTGSITLIRLIVLTMSCLFGLVGLFLTVFLLLIYMASLNSFGMPYLTPFSPTWGQDIWHNVLAIPKRGLKKRPIANKSQDPTRQGDS